MNPKISAILLLASCTTLMISCKTSFYAVPPEYSTQTVKYEPKPSVISIPISIPFALINTELNKQLSGLIYDDQDFDGPVTKDNLKVSVYRTKREIKVDGNKNKLRFQVPLEIYAYYRWQACSFCPEIVEGTSFEMDLTLVSTLSIGSDWKLQPSTTATDFSFPVKPMLDLGFTEIDITSIVKSALRDNMLEITYALDQEIAEAIPIKEQMESAWSTMQEPILVDSSYKTWLVLKPNYFMMQPLSCTSTEAVLTAGVETFVETRLGAEPVVAKKNTLASPFQKDKIDPKFSIELPVTIDFDFATELARQNLKDSVFEVSKKKKIKIDDIEIYGVGGDVYVKATLSGKLEGIVYLKGKPAIDTVTNKIYFENFDFDINTRNGLIKVANWLAHGTLKKIFQKNFTYNISDDLETARGTIQELLNGYNYDGIFTITGQMGSLHLKQIFADENGITAIFKGEGTAAMKIDGFGN